MSFADKIAIVTGGASGIGEALCKQLAAAGARVWVTDIDGDGAARVASALGPAATARPLDVCDAAAVRDLVAEVAQSHGRIDYMFNNAGIAIVGEVLHTKLDDWYRVFDINVRGVIHGIDAAYPLMVRQGSGHIVNTASVAGLVPAPGLAAYCGTKHAVVGISKSLRIEAATHGVRVSAVCPGFIKTRIIDNATVRGLERDEAASAAPFWYDVDRCARDLLRGVRKNHGIIVVTGHGKQLYRISRFAPGLIDWLGKKALARRLARQA